MNLIQLFGITFCLPDVVVFLLFVCLFVGLLLLLLFLISTEGDQGKSDKGRTVSCITACVLSHEEQFRGEKEGAKSKRGKLCQAKRMTNSHRLSCDEIPHSKQNKNYSM